ncbi:MAG: hypothetical protein U9O53_05240 [archaeon]|nr:hypothetical protein [archaeon]
MAENKEQPFPVNFRGKRIVYHTALDEKTNRPKEYIVAGTPGEPTIPQMWQYQGLAGKIVKGAKEGYDFLELDLWNDAEILEPHLAERIEQLRTTHRVDVGLHLRVNLDLTSALGPVWDVNHKSLISGVLGATEVVKANFILMHSAATPILEFGEAAARTAPSTLVTPWKGNLAEFIEKPLHKDNEAKVRIVDKKEITPRHDWNVFNEDNGTDENKEFETQCNSEPYVKEPTMKDWALARFVKDIWYPGAVPDAKVVVALSKVESLKEVRRAYKEAFEKMQKYFDINLSDENKFYKKFNEKIKKEINRKTQDIIKNDADSIKINELEEKIKTLDNNSGEFRNTKRKIDELTAKLKEKIKNKQEEIINRYTSEYADFKQLLEHQSSHRYTYDDLFAQFFKNMILCLKNALGKEYEKKKFNKMVTIKPTCPLDFSDTEKDELRALIKDMDNIREKNYVHIMYIYEQMGIDKNYRFWVQKGAEAEEQVAYRTIAKWMYIVKDALYEEIVTNDREIKRWWSKKENQAEVFKHNHEYVYQLKKENTPDKNLEIFLDPDNIITYTNASGDPLNLPIRKMVAAISAKYIQGHLDRPMEKDTNLYLERGKAGEKFFDASIRRQLKNMLIDPQKGEARDNFKTVYRYMYDEGVHFYIETQDVLQEEWRGKIRIMRLTDHIAIIKAFKKHYGFDNVSYTMDFEHLTGNLLNPRQQIELVDGKEGDAKYISMIHINPPSAAQGLHKVIKRMSFDAEYIYGWLFELKKKGMSGAYFVWEMGKDTGGGTYEAPLALRALAGELKKGTKPSELPEEFFGIDANFRAMQVQAIKAHGLDPLRDMFFYKADDHTFIGQMARAANAEIADKEKLR